MSLFSRFPFVLSAALAVTGAASLADEGGVSFWMPGQYGSFAAIAPSKGWSLPVQGYGYSGSIGGNRPTKAGNDLTAELDTDFDGVFVIPTYVPDWTLWGRPRPSRLPESSLGTT